MKVSPLLSRRIVSSPRVKSERLQRNLPEVLLSLAPSLHALINLPSLSGARLILLQHTGQLQWTLFAHKFNGEEVCNLSSPACGFRLFGLPSSYRLCLEGPASVFSLSSVSAFWSRLEGRVFGSVFNHCAYFTFAPLSSFACCIQLVLGESDALLLCFVPRVSQFYQAQRGVQLASLRSFVVPSWWLSTSSLAFSEFSVSNTTAISVLCFQKELSKALHQACIASVASPKGTAFGAKPGGNNRLARLCFRPLIRSWTLPAFTSRVVSSMPANFCMSKHRAYASPFGGAFLPALPSWLAWLSSPAP